MSHNPEPGRPQPHRRLTADQHEAMASCPHTPSPELFNRAARAHHRVYNEKNPARQARPPPGLPPRRDHGRHQARPTTSASKPFRNSGTSAASTPAPRAGPTS